MGISFVFNNIAGDPHMVKYIAPRIEGWGYRVGVEDKKATTAIT